METGQIQLSSQHHYLSCIRDLQADSPEYSQADNTASADLPHGHTYTFLHLLFLMCSLCVEYSGSPEFPGILEVF